MKYTRQSVNNVAVKESYDFIYYMIEKQNNSVVYRILHADSDVNGNIVTDVMTGDIHNIKHMVVDPDWDDQSVPPKPVGFDEDLPSTWGNLSWDDIPKVIDSTTLYATDIIANISGGANIEQEIFDTLITLGQLPLSSEGWIFE